MSKLKEIIHQYVVEALQEILSEEHNPELDKLVDKYSGQILKARDSQYPEAHEDEAGDILKQIQRNHGKEAVLYARMHAQRNLDDLHHQENEKNKAELKANYKPTSGPAVKQYKESVEEGYKEQIRLARALQKDPSNENLKAKSNKAFNIGIERVRRRMAKRYAEHAQKASQTDPHDQNF